MAQIEKNNLMRLVDILRTKSSNIPFHRYTSKKFSTSWWMVELDGENAPVDFDSFKEWCFTYLGLDEESYKWLFSDGWHLVDTSSTSLCDRINTLVLHGLPENWSFS